MGSCPAIQNGESSLSGIDQIRNIVLHLVANVIEGQIIGIPAKGIFNFDADLFNAKQHKAQPSHNGAGHPTQALHHLKR